MPSRPTLRTLLVLGRVSNLPTVWTNCLSGWLIGGGGSELTLLLVILGASLVYVGGMYLNDAFDAVFDRQYRRERPIPAELISEILVWEIGSALLAGGGLTLAFLGWSTAGFSGLLVLTVLLYDAVHKAVALSPVIMAGCRFFLLLAAASTGEDGVTGLALWSALALAGWIVGLSYIARRESAAGPMKWWPLFALTLPLILAVLVNDGEYRLRAFLAGGVLLTWGLWCLGHSFWSTQPNLGRTVSGLLAGICLVDLLAIPHDTASTVFCLTAFGAARLAQRYVPAT